MDNVSEHSIFIFLTSLLSSLGLWQVRLAARFLIVGIGSIPNSELFHRCLDLSPDGGIMTDSSLCTSHPSGDVFAAGDVARPPIPLACKTDGTSSPAVGPGYAKAARDMGTHAAQAMLGGPDPSTPYDPVPFLHAR